MQQFDFRVPHPIGSPVYGSPHVTIVQVMVAPPWCYKKYEWKVNKTESWELHIHDIK
jgi:hypothetical protein